MPSLVGSEMCIRDSSLLLGKESNLSLETLLAQEAQILEEFGRSWLLSQTNTAACDRLFSFLEGRLRFLLEEKGFAFEVLSLIHISEPTRLGMISYAVFC